MTNSQEPIARWRVSAFLAIIGLVMGLFIARLFSLQVLQYDEWLARAEENRVEELNLPAPRGAIFDRNGVVLARNIASYNVVVTPAYLPDDPGKVDAILAEIARLTGVPLSRGEISPETPYVPCRSEHGVRQIVFYGETTAPYRRLQHLP